MARANNPNRKEMIVTGILDYNEGRNILDRHVFIYTPSGESFYEDKGVRIPKKQFEQIYASPLVSNRYPK